MFEAVEFEPVSVWEWCAVVEVAPVVVKLVATALALPRIPDVFAEAVLEPTGAKAIRLGKLKVVEPSPLPYLMSRFVNRVEYVVRETAVPSQSKNPAGTSEVV
jgi:hypothetical protein